MYLKSLVLKGFKSFADRSVLTLEPGITAVVGPNGSGKSNISDAVLWVLGERNAKNLRGQVMEDVIFAGSSARKSVGVAEVSLVLDNSDGALPVDYTEVAVTRRMYRSGESEYLINGSLARRMDVLDILHDTGLGTGTHSIIGQGSLDSILQSKPEDRRALIEEAAGVLKHKQRKAKSERKLEQMDQHLARVRDVVSEVQRQLGPLERKAKRAIAYQGLSEELAGLSLELAVDDLRALQRQWDQAQASEHALEAELDKRREAIAEAEAAVECIQAQIRQENESAMERARRQRAAESAVDRFDSTVLVVREKERSAGQRAAELAAALEANAAKRTLATSQREKASAQLAEARAQREQAQAAVEQAQDAHAKAAAARTELERQASEFAQAGREREREVEQARRELVRTQENLSRSMGRVQLVEERGEELAARIEQATAEAEARKVAAEEAAACLADVEAREAAAREAADAARAASTKARAAHDAAYDAERTAASEIRGIEEVERAAAAAAGPARAWLLSQGEGVGAGLAPLAHEVKAEPGFEALTERLLGADVAALLVQDASRARAVADALAARREEGEVVLVLREDAPATLPARSAAAQGLGTALVDKVQFPEDARRAVEALLGDVVVCETLADALAAHERAGASLRFAAKDGRMVWPNGKVTLGAAVAGDGEGMLARARKLDEARARHKKASTELEAAAQAAKQASAAVSAAQEQSLALRQELASLRGNAAAAKDAARTAADKLAAVQRELAGLERQRAEAQAAVEQARPTVDALTQRVGELDAAIGQGKERLAQAQDAVAPAREEEARLAAALSDARLQAATLAERETYASRVMETSTRELAALDAADAEARATRAHKLAVQQRAIPLLAVLEELAMAAGRTARSLEEGASVAQDVSAGMHAQATAAREKAREVRSAYDQTNERLSEARVGKGRLEVQVEAAVGVIVHDCKTPLETALALPELPDRAEVEGRAFKLRRRIANMGTINPDAAEEYEQLKERYDYLASQLADLDSARSALTKINRVIDARMKDDFIRTFEQVNKNFQEIFAVLFPGGTAELTLVDPNDLENTGVEVTAQPRGKRITKMMLMSGGEKSLTALALLFAAYRIRSTPFYILDEVEAALDDSNLRRLTAYLAELRSSTQLIMITHQRRTMEMSDVLFGVSMQADGVTKVVSQKLEHALKHAE